MDRGEACSGVRFRVHPLQRLSLVWWGATARVGHLGRICLVTEATRVSFPATFGTLLMLCFFKHTHTLICNCLKISCAQVLKTRMEADEVTVKLELCDKENKALKDEMAKEIENVSVTLSKRRSIGTEHLPRCFRLPVKGFRVPRLWKEAAPAVGGAHIAE